MAEIISGRVPETLPEGASCPTCGSELVVLGRSGLFVRVFDDEVYPVELACSGGHTMLLFDSGDLCEEDAEADFAEAGDGL